MEKDRRKVQTAVTTTPDSHTPAYMPLDQDEAATFQEQAHRSGTTFWCGTLLGGCGSKLSTKIYRARRAAPHFAHHHTAHRCARHARGAESADHLYAAHQLRTWAQNHTGEPLHPHYIGDFDQGQGCDQLLLTSTDEKTRLRLVFTPTLSTDLKTLATSTANTTTRWLIKDNPSLVRTLIEHRVPFHRFRLLPRDLTRVLEVRVVDATGTPRWTTPEAALAHDARALDPTPTQTPTPRAKPSQSALTTALRGLEHSLDHGTGKDVRDFSERVRRHLAAPDGQATSHEHDRARELLARAGETLGTSTPTDDVDPTRWRQQVKDRHERDRRRGTGYQRRKDRELEKRKEQVETELRRIEGLREEVKDLTRQLRTAWQESDWTTYKTLYQSLTRIRRSEITPKNIRDQVQNALKDLPYLGEPVKPPSRAYRRRRLGIEEFPTYPDRRKPRA
ncbi:competence protein CoiA family protein [Nocardiopsis alba]|uniref:competence protein CoiA family protein n=1 Tax=Nocardiopsis alba TaxID=53437 RepID=UPI0033BBE70C